MIFNSTGNSSNKSFQFCSNSQLQVKHSIFLNKIFIVLSNIVFFYKKKKHRDS